MCIHLLIKDSIVVPCQASQALDMLWDIPLIQGYEPKLTEVTVHPITETRGTYDTRGFFAGLPWQGQFSYELKPNGFVSEMLSGPLPGLHVSGGFEVEALDKERCLVTHYEKYQYLGWFLILPLVPAMYLYLTLAMKQELKDIKRLILEQVTAQQRRSLSSRPG